MMKLRLFAAAVAAAAFALPASAEHIKSGPQEGANVPGPFHPVNVTGEHKGEKFCLFCVNGENPVAMIFAREGSPELAKLVKKIDEATAKNKEKSMGSFVVFLSDKEGLDKELASMAEKEKIKSTVLSIDNPAGRKNLGRARPTSPPLSAIAEGARFREHVEPGRVRSSCTPSATDGWTKS